MVGHGQWRHVPWIPAAMVLLAACGPLRSSSAPAGGARSSDLTAAQLQDFSTVLEAVQALRGGWLRQRTPLFLAPGSGTARASPVWVYWDGTRLGDSSQLDRISTADVQRVIHFSAREASVRWGVGHENGVIYIVPVAGAAGPVFR